MLRTSLSAADDNGGGSTASAVEQASLDYSSDSEPGIVRRRAGKGFWYADSKGRRVTDGDTLGRIRSLAIPPAWKEVWISPTPTGHIQATGRDERGRKQYRYHSRWTACRDEVKYSSLTGFARALPRLRKRIECDLATRGLSYQRVLASIVWLLDNSMIRVGNASYARENKSFGLTTLRDRHVEISGATLRFAFRGKSGKEWKLGITDRRIARIVKGAQDLPGQHLFQYIDEAGSRRAVNAQDVNRYIREASGADFSSKHFRTWGGTVRAAELFATTDLPETKRGMALAVNRTIDEVAARLGNTRAVCRKCYVHPVVVAAWAEGRLGGDLTAIRRRYRRPPSGLSSAEAIVLRWLEQTEGKAVAGP